MRILAANRESSDKINKLRLEAYQYGTNAQIPDFSFLRWNKNDDNAVVLFIENDSYEAISSMRGIMVNSKTEIESLLDIKINYNIETPALIIDRSTTDTNFRRIGLSAVLRYLFINACINSNIKNIASTVNEGVSRIPHLKQIGYSFKYADTTKRKKQVYVNSSKVLFGSLNYLHFSQAAEVAKKQLKINLSFFNVEKSSISKLNSFLALENSLIKEMDYHNEI